jgi:hypothetical protein
MGFESPMKSEEQEKDPLSLLKKDSLELSHIGLAGIGGNLHDEMKMKMRPETWNEHQGVIVYADKQGKVYAIPSSESARNKMQELGIEKDEIVEGVPHLNDADVWGTEERREKMATFHQWKGLVEEEQRRQQAEVLAQASAAREVFGDEGAPEKKE